MSAVTKNGCLETHVSIDKFLTSPLQTGFKNIVHHLKTKSDYGFQNRLIIAAQAIISLVVLPFKMLFALFTGVDTMLHPNDLRSWANLGYALGSVAVHAMLVPIGLLLALLPMSAIDEIKDLNGEDIIKEFTPVTTAGEEYFKSVEESMPKRKSESKPKTEPNAEIEEMRRPPPFAAPLPGASQDAMELDRQPLDEVLLSSGKNARESLKQENLTNG